MILFLKGWKKRLMFGSRIKQEKKHAFEWIDDTGETIVDLPTGEIIAERRMKTPVQP